MEMERHSYESDIKYDMAYGQTLAINGSQPFVELEVMRRVAGCNSPVVAGLKTGDNNYLVFDLRNNQPANNRTFTMDGQTIPVSGDFLVASLDADFETNSDFAVISDDNTAVRIGGYLGNGKIRRTLASATESPQDYFELSVWGDSFSVRNINHYAPTSLMVNKRQPLEELFVKHGPNAIMPMTPERKLPFRLELGLAEKPYQRNEDRSLIRPDAGVYAVFDGAGGVGFLGAGAVAAETAARAIEKFNFVSGVEKLTDVHSTGLELADAMNQANHATKRAGNGVTAATVARIVPTIDDRGRTGNHLVWASAGDCRIYMRRSGHMSMLSRDEGIGSRIFNCLGGDGEVVQYGAEAVRPGDEYILVSDGITGDKGTDLMDDAELLQISKKATSASKVAEGLLRQSRKRDDKTALVIRVS